MSSFFLRQNLPSKVRLDMGLDPLKLKYPIVLVHGLGAQPKYGPADYFFELPPRLRAAGNKVLSPRLSSFNTVEVRAAQLKEQIAEAFPDERVNIIGHSFGGLDARFLAAQADFAEHIASVTTIGTPNRGCLIADLALDFLPDGAFDVADKVMNLFQNSSRAYYQISREYHLNDFAVVAPDSPHVAYFSATSVISNPVTTALPMFWVPHRVIQRYEGENDGFISLESAKWGTHICTYVGDHYGQIGHFVGFSRGLDYNKFFDEIILRLKKEGF
jgi:triacylglycerol lipase